MKSEGHNATHFRVLCRPMTAGIKLDGLPELSLISVIIVKKSDGACLLLFVDKITMVLANVVYKIKWHDR